jgi:stage V sporulation protein B
LPDKLATDANPGLPEGVKRILRNSSLNLGGEILYALLQLVVVFVLARCLGKSGLGHYYTIISMMLIVQLVAESGAATLLTQRIAQSPDTWRPCVAEAAGVFTVISLVSALLILVLGGGWYVAQGQAGWVPAVLGAAVACGAIQFQRFGAGVFQAFELFVVENIAKVLQGTLFVIGLLLLAACDAFSMNTVMATLAISHVITTIFLMRKLSAYCGGLGWRFSMRLVSHWWRRASPIGCGDVLRKLTWQVDTVVLALFASPAQVGMYSVAYRPLGPLNWIPRGVLSATFPSVARQAEVSRESAQKLFARSTRLLVVLGLPVAIGVFFAAESLIVLLAGEQFADSAGLLQVLIGAIVLSFVSLQFRFFLTAVNLHGYYAWIVAVILGTKILLQLILVPIWGCYGACLGSLVSEALFTLLGLYVCIRIGIARVEWDLLQRAAVASLLMGATAWCGHTFGVLLLLPWLGLAAGVYLMACFGMKVFRKEESDCVKHLASRIARRVLQTSIVFVDRTP